MTGIDAAINVVLKATPVPPQPLNLVEILGSGVIKEIVKASLEDQAFIDLLPLHRFCMNGRTLWIIIGDSLYAITGFPVH